MQLLTYNQRYRIYDSFLDRDWTFLSLNEKMRLVDSNVVKQALASGETADEVKQILFYGSHYCQMLSSFSDRIVYVSEILREVCGKYD